MSQQQHHDQDEKSAGRPASPGPTAPGDGGQSAPRCKRSSRCGKFFGISIAVLVGALIGGVAMGAFSHGYAGFGGFGGGLFHGGCRGHGGAEDNPEARRERLNDRVSWVLRHVDPTPEQEARVQELAADAVEDLRAMAGERRDIRQALLAGLAEPEVDRAALEAHRAQALALAETASARLVDAAMDLSEALTPAQRAQLVSRFQERFHH